MGEFSLAHIIIVGLIILILFGSDKLPTFGQSLGRAINGFKKGLQEANDETTRVTHEINAPNKNNQVESQPENSNQKKS